MKRLIFIITAFYCQFSANAQDDFDKTLTLGLFAGAINYQGDLKPNSFTFQHSNLMLSLSVRKPLNRWFAVKGGVSIGKVEAADMYNRDYLRARNLSFKSSLKEVFAQLEVSLLDFSAKKFTPYAYGGLVLFHFNPYTYDANDGKVFLQPLSTEGQGLADYPDRKVYKLNQFAAAFGGGFKIGVSNCTSISIEFSQRKTFTDYLDDVSTTYVDQGKLLAAKGQRAVDLSYRGDEVHNPLPFPPDGEQRGTPTEADWYYFVGISADVRISCLKEKISGLLKGGSGGNSKFYKRCPTVY